MPKHVLHPTLIHQELKKMHVPDRKHVTHTLAATAALIAITAVFVVATGLLMSGVLSLL